MAVGDHERRPVVVGVDSSGSARHASEWAADLASAWDVPLRLVHSVRDGENVTEVPPWLRELFDGAERVGAGPVDAEVVPGAPGDVLLDRSGAARLLVVGSYGEGARAGMLDVLVKPVLERHADLDVERRVVNDTALRALLDQARDARMVVVGHRRAAVIGRLGSTSRGLVEFAPCPVVVV